MATTGTTRAECSECGAIVNYVQFDFIANAQSVAPCGHHASIIFKPIAA